VFDGGMGTSFQAADLSADDFGGDDLDGCNEVLVRTRPDIVERVHRSFLDVGVHAVQTNTFGGAPWVLDEYDLGEDTEDEAGTAERPTGIVPPAEHHSPVPAPFLSISGRLHVDLIGESPEDLHTARTWLTDAGQELGIGGRTSAGYGYFTCDVIEEESW
jgi:hypothetical protein